MTNSGGVRGLPVRVPAATVLATAAAAITYCTVFRAWGSAWTEPLFPFGMLGFVLTTWGVTTWLYRGTRGARWLAARERRWVFGGALLGVGEVALLTLLLVVAVGDLLARGEPAPDTLYVTSSVGDAVVMSVVAWIYGSVLTGLPVWLLTSGLLIGPGSRRTVGSTAETVAVVVPARLSRCHLLCTAVRSALCTSRPKRARRAK